MAGTPSLFDDLPHPERGRGSRAAEGAPEFTEVRAQDRADGERPARAPAGAAPAARQRTDPPAEDGPQRQEPAPGAPRVMTVGQLTGRLRGALEELGAVSVEGEVSRVTRAASGHLYFDLKDDGAKLACTVWRSSAKNAVRFELAEGMQVVAHGRLDIYAPRGTYSLNVRRLEQSGIGLLLAQFEELKRELAARGWFERRRPLPRMPRVVGVVTSRDGAALRDFLRTRTLRWPAYPLRLAHAPVQGPGASIELARAIERLDASGVDVIVVTRGGGSIEDLWAFNELPVAAAIRAASVPVVSGVGHETDTTLADLVADFRAHTPTDAAQTVIPERRALVNELERLSSWLLQAMDGLLCDRATRLERARSSRVLRDARWITEDRERRLMEQARRLGAALERRLGQAAARLAEGHRRLQRESPRAQLYARAERVQRARLKLVPAGWRLLERREQGLELAAARLEAYSPVRILAGGYSITTRVARDGPEGAGPPLRDAGSLAVGDTLVTRLARGRVVSAVTEVHPEPAVERVEPRTGDSPEVSPGPRSPEAGAGA